MYDPQILQPIQEGDFIHRDEFVVFLPDFLVATGLVESKKAVKRLIANKVRVTLITNHVQGATFNKMPILDIWNHYAFIEGEQIMLGSGGLNRETNQINLRDLKREHAVPIWRTMPYKWIWDDAIQNYQYEEESPALRLYNTLIAEYQELKRLGWTRQ